MGTTPTGSGTTARSAGLYPLAPPAPATVPGDGPDTGAASDPRPADPVPVQPPGEVATGPLSATPEPDPEQDARAEGRRALRAARKRRRRVSLGCAALIAVCTAITLIIVGMARERSPGPQVVRPVAGLALPASFDLRSPPITGPTETLGAAASIGGQR